jgi:hypothetical protein
MLKPIPTKILRSTASVRVCTGVDRYQNQIYSEYTVKNIHVQPTNEIRKTPNNTDCTLRSILFADVRHSTPFDWWEQFKTAHENAGDVRVIVNGVEYTVESVDALKDDTDKMHHWEIGLV